MCGTLVRARGRPGFLAWTYFSCGSAPPITGFSRLTVPSLHACSARLISDLHPCSVVYGSEYRSMLEHSTGYSGVAPNTSGGGSVLTLARCACSITLEEKPLCSTPWPLRKHMTRHQLRVNCVRHGAAKDATVALFTFTEVKVGGSTHLDDGHVENSRSEKRKEKCQEST